MTTPIGPTPTERVGRGALLALLIIPVGVVVFLLISSIGFVASIVSFGVAIGAFWLYQRGAGGVVSRAGAWVVLAIVVVTTVLGIFASLVWDFAAAVASDPQVKAAGLNGWDVFNRSAFWPAFGDNFGYQLSHEALFVILAFVFAALGAFRVLRRAFLTTSTRPAQTAPPVQQTYRNDVDAPPTGSADDKTTPPTNGV